MSFHELIEIEEIKKRNIKITHRVILENPKIVYEAHIEALEEELEFALQKDDKQWIKIRLEDLKSYLEDENLPEKLRPKVMEFLNSYQNLE